MTRRHSERLQIAQEAAQWLHLMKEDRSESHAAFVAWLKESPRHVEEVLFATAFDRTLARLDTQRRIDLPAILREISTTVVPLEKEVATASRKSQARTNTVGRWRLGAAACAGGLIVMAAVLWLSPWGSLHRHSYETAVGEQRVLELEDGSVIHLNTQARVEVRFSAQARDIQLVSGEALFKVKHDAARPFRVHTLDALVQAVGTEFDVYRRPEVTQISVIEGVVRVTQPSNKPATTAVAPGIHAAIAPPAISLAAGDELRVNRDGVIAKQRTSDPSRIAAWRQRRLVFQNDTLADIAAEFNRYNRAPQIRIEGENVRNRRFSGIFDADDPEAIAALLGEYSDLVTEKSAGELVVRAR